MDTKPIDKMIDALWADESYYRVNPYVLAFPHLSAEEFEDQYKDTEEAKDLQWVPTSHGMIAISWCPTTGTKLITKN